MTEEEKKELKELSIECLVGYLSSGRTQGSVDGYLYSVEEAAIVVAERFLKKFKERTDVRSK